MRYPEEKIKDAILHPDPKVRDRAVRYFSKSYSPDPSLIPLVIRAIETYEKKTAYQIVGDAGALRQTPETAAWLVKEVNDPNAAAYENYVYNLSRALLAVDPALLVPHETALRGAPIPDEMKGPIFERIEMLPWDAATCWRELDRFAVDNKDAESLRDVNYGRGQRIAEALARHGPACEARVRDLLSQEITDFAHNPMVWLEPLAVRLVGLARLDALVPRVLHKLHEDADLLSQECEEALTRIGTPAVVEAVADIYPTADSHWRIYATGVLEHIRSDRAVQKLVMLLEREENRRNRLLLAHALLEQFATEGVEAARQLLLGRPQLEFEERGLRQELLETCAFTGERFPEYDAWNAAEQEDMAEHWRRVAELKDDPHGLVLFALEKLTGQKIPASPPPRPIPPAPPFRLPPTRPPRAKVGRNDPCPCGSGKKFKNCCLKK